MRLERVCWPALVPWGALAWELAYGMGGLIREELPLQAHLLTFTWAPALAAAASLVLLASDLLRRKVWAFLEEGAGAWPWLAAAGVFAYLTQFYLARYRAQSLPAIDTTDTIALAWGFLHGNGTYSVVRGFSILSLHFHLIQALAAPVFAALPWPPVILVLQAALLATAGLSGFFLTKRLTRSTGAAWGAMALLLAGAPMLAMVRSTVFYQLALGPLFLAAAYCEESGRRRLSWALWAVFLASSEQGAVCLAGYALYQGITALERKDKRGLISSVLVIAGCSALFVFEMKLKSWLGAEGAHYGFAYYARLFEPAAAGGAWADLLLSWPTYRPTALLLLALAFLPLASGRRLLVLFVAALPQLLAVPGSALHRYENLQATYVFGPAAWCAIHGLARLRAGTSKPGRLGLIPAVVALLMSLALLLFPPKFIDYHSFFWGATARSTRAATRRVPPGASVWTVPAGGPNLAARNQIKLLTPDVDFYRGLFTPEYIVTAKSWGTERGSAEILTFMAREDYRKIFDADGLVVLKHPRAPFGGPSPGMTLPKRDKTADDFRRYLDALPDFAQKETEDYYRARVGWGEWIAFSQELGRILPRGAFLVHSGRWYPLPPLLTLFGGVRGLALAEQIGSVSGRGPNALEEQVRAARARGAPVYALSEALTPEAMEYLDAMHPVLRMQAQAVLSKQRYEPERELAFPGGRRVTVLRMLPNGEKIRRDARRTRR
jgi:uncharacterized membrane protein